MAQQRVSDERLNQLKVIVPASGPIMCEVRDLIADLQDARNLLKRLQWNGSVNDAINVMCPCCGCSMNLKKHSNNCELAQVIGGES